MRLNLILILATLATFTLAQGLIYDSGFSFNPNSCRISNFDSSWFVLRCQCGLNTGYQFTDLPEGWYSLNENVYIPRNKLQRRMVYPCKASFTDKRLNKILLQKLLLLVYDDDFQRIVDQNYDFDFNDRVRTSQFLQRCGSGYKFYRDYRYNSPQFPIVLPQSQGFIPSNTVFQPPIVNPYIDFYPSDDQCQKVILQGNCGRIKEIISYVTQNKDNCKKRADFLSKLQDKIQNRIDSYRTDAQNLRQTIFKLQAKLNQLKEKSQKYQYGNNDEINQRIRKYRQQINRYGRERDEYQSQCRGTREAIIKLRQEIQNIKLATLNSRRAVEEQEQRCRFIDRNIAQLQAKLATLRQDRQQSRRKRQYHQRIIDESLRRIQECNFKIVGHEKYLSDYDIKTKSWVTYIDDFNKKIEGCNRQIEGYKSNRGLYKSEEVIRKISELQQEIAINQKQADKLVSIYKALQQKIDEFEELISKHYYQCYNYLPPKNEKNKRGHYLIQGQAFQKYLKDTFGQAPNQNIRARFTGIVDLKRFTPLSVSWTKVYDIPSTVGYGSNMDKAENNYKCTQSENLKTICAKIEEINRNFIKVVDKNGDRFSIQLGGCTRMELVSDKELPQKGQQIICKGLLKGQSTLFAHHLTCY